MAAHRPHLHPGDGVITDRGDAGWRHFAQVGAAGGHFVSRCSRGSFPAVPALFARDEAGVSQTVVLQAPPQVRSECRHAGWPLELRVRPLTVRLATEELEVLATSLLEEAVAQDFFALLLLSNVESVVSGPARWELEQVSARREQAVQVNRAVGLPALKTRLIDLLGRTVPAGEVLEELTRWFVPSPVSGRAGRSAPRRKASPARSYHYQRRVRKLVF